MANNLCIYCGKKPKFNNFDYCSKTCASQSGSGLCSYCNKVPKFQNYDYCSKRCGALASGATGTKAPPNKGPQGAKQNKPSNLQTAANTLSQLATLLPQAQALLTGLGAASGMAPPPGKPASNQQRAPNNAGAGQFIVVNSPAVDADLKANGGTAICLIPGCGKPAYSIKGVKASDYCSAKHRDEALNSTQADASSLCIMCLIEPQSNVDHFCGAACRNRALNKPVASLPDE